MDEKNYVTVSLPKPMGIVFEENDSEFGTSDFDLLPGGYRSNGQGNYNYVPMGDGFFWSSTECQNTTAWGRILNYGYSAIGRGSFSKSYGFSVRCIKD